MKSRVLVITGVLAAAVLGACGGGGAISGPNPVMKAAAIEARAATATLSVDLSASATVHALVNTGSPVSGGGVDGSGNAYSETLTGTSISWDGATFALGAPGTANAVSNITLGLPAGNYSKVDLLATGVNGNQAGQVFVVHYTDGSGAKIVQSLSDWRTPQNYAGESKVLTMAYRIKASGAIDAGPYSLYGYSLSIDGTKTVQSITLPSDRSVVVIAIDLFPAGPALPTAAGPTMNPPPRSYSTAQAVVLSDTTRGAVIYYTTNGTPPTTASAIYSAPLQVSTTTTIAALAAASGYSNSAVVSGTYTIAGAAPVSVNLAAAANVHGLVNTGSPVSGGGMDGSGHAYSETLTGSSISWGGTTFTLGVAGTANAVSNATVALPPGMYSSLKLLGAAVNGDQANQTFTVNYADGSSTRIVQSLSDWRTPQRYAGESTALTMAYRLTASGAADAGPYYLYGYSIALNATKILKSLTLPANRNVVMLALTLIPASSSNLCDPLSFGAVGDGTTDNTAAIQNAVTTCAAQGGGTVELRVVGNQAVYLTGPVTLASHVHLQVDQGVTLQGTNDHSRYVPAWINWVYQPKEALISATGATDVGVIGAGIIDGAGGQLQPNGSPSWWTLQERSPAAKSARPFLLEFYQCDHVTVSGVTLQNSPFWTQVLRFSHTITVSGVKILAPVTAPNSDGVDVVGSTNVVLTDLNISVGDDNLAFKSGLPIDPTDPRQAGLPHMATSQVEVSNITTQNGDGIVFGSEAVNGVNNVSIQNVHYTFTAYGIRIKSARDRGGQIYNITADGLVMDGVTLPLSISDYYTSSGGVGPIEPPYEAAQPITSTTPYVHDITIKNVVATSAAQHSLIEGLPESCIHNVNLNNVSIQTKDVGITLRHMTGTFTNLPSAPAPPDPPFIVQENVTVATAGTTPPIAATPPRAGQVACSAQVVPPP